MQVWTIIISPWSSFSVHLSVNSFGIPYINVCGFLHSLLDWHISKLVSSLINEIKIWMLVINYPFTFLNIFSAHSIYFITLKNKWSLLLPLKNTTWRPLQPGKQVGWTQTFFLFPSSLQIQSSSLILSSAADHLYHHPDLPLLFIYPSSLGTHRPGQLGKQVSYCRFCSLPQLLFI